MPFESKTNQELNQMLAELLGEFSPVPDGEESTIIGDVLHSIDNKRRLEGRHPGYIDDWGTLMELALEHGAYLSPLAWERSEKRYRASHFAMLNGEMCQFGTPYTSDDDCPGRAITMTLIKIISKK